MHSVGLLAARRRIAWQRSRSIGHGSGLLDGLRRIHGQDQKQSITWHPIRFEFTTTDLAAVLLTEGQQSDQSNSTSNEMLKCDFTLGPIPMSWYSTAVLQNEFSSIINSGFMQFPGWESSWVGPEVAPVPQFVQNFRFYTEWLKFSGILSVSECTSPLEIAIWKTRGVLFLKWPRARPHHHASAVRACARGRCNDQRANRFNVDISRVVPNHKIRNH